MPILASDLTRLLGNRGVTVYQDPFSRRAEEITRRAILRADTHGMENYGPAPDPLDEKRDLYQEGIEELLDAIYYLTRQVARLEDLRQRTSETPGASPALSGVRDAREVLIPTPRPEQEGLRQ